MSEGDVDRTIGERIVDQPPPRPTDGTKVWDLVIADMAARDRIGTERYGTPLQVENGRDHLIDAYQEILDLAVYLRAEIERRRTTEKRIAEFLLRAGLSVRDEATRVWLTNEQVAALLVDAMVV